MANVTSRKELTISFMGVLSLRYRLKYIDACVHTTPVSLSNGWFRYQWSEWGARKVAHIAAMLVPMKMAPKVEAMLLAMILRSMRGDRWEREGGGSSTDLTHSCQGPGRYRRDLRASHAPGTGG